MTEKVTRISTLEMCTVRVTCHHCSLTTELDVSMLSKAIGQSGDCRFCNETLISGNQSNPFYQLKNALERINEASERVTVEFSFSEPADGK